MIEHNIWKMNHKHIARVKIYWPEIAFGKQELHMNKIDDTSWPV